MASRLDGFGRVRGASSDGKAKKQKKKAKKDALETGGAPTPGKKPDNAKKEAPVKETESAVRLRGVDARPHRQLPVSRKPPPPNRVTHKNRGFTLWAHPGPCGFGESPGPNQICHRLRSRSHQIQFNKLPVLWAIPQYNRFPQQGKLSMTGLRPSRRPLLWDV